MSADFDAAFLQALRLVAKDNIDGDLSIRGWILVDDVGGTFL